MWEPSQHEESSVSASSGTEVTQDNECVSGKGEGDISPAGS